MLVKINVEDTYIYRMRPPQVSLPEDWTLEKALPPQEEKEKPIILKPNTNIKQITQLDDGTIKLSFRRSPNLIIKDDASTSSTIDLGKVSNLPKVINLEDKYQKGIQ